MGKFVQIFTHPTSKTLMKATFANYGATRAMNQ